MNITKIDQLVGEFYKNHPDSGEFKKITDAKKAYMKKQILELIADNYKNKKTIKIEIELLRDIITNLQDMLRMHSSKYELLNNPLLPKMNDLLSIIGK